MKVSFEFWILSFSLVFVRAIDALVTFTITPDLSHEGNPLVYIADLGWTTLLIVNSLVVCLTIFILYFSIRFPADSHPTEGNYSFKEFISHFLYNDKFSFHKIYFFVPHNKKAILSFTGFLFPRVFISWSLLIIIHNVSILHSSLYQQYNIHWNLWIIVYTFLVPITFFYFWKFFRNEYGKYRKLSSSL